LKIYITLRQDPQNHRLLFGAAPLYGTTVSSQYATVLRNPPLCNNLLFYSLSPFSGTQNKLLDFQFNRANRPFYVHHCCSLQLYKRIPSCAAILTLPSTDLTKGYTSSGQWDSGRVHGLFLCANHLFWISSGIEYISRINVTSTRISLFRKHCGQSTPAGSVLRPGHHIQKNRLNFAS
jgi:hypothetical protein